MKMKFNLFVLVVLIVSLCSCTTTRLSNKGNVINDRVVAAAAADLEISPKKITYTMNRPPKAYWKAGSLNVINAAVSEALMNSDADVLVGLQYTYTTNAIGKVKTVTVSGYPAKYHNFRSVKDESVAVQAISGTSVIINK